MIPATKICSEHLSVMISTYPFHLISIYLISVKIIRSALKITVGIPLTPQLWSVYDRMRSCVASLGLLRFIN